MSIYDHQLMQKIDSRLRSFDKKRRPLPGIHAAANRESLVRQIVDSVHRIKYVSVIGARNLSKLRRDPSSQLFDPLKAAVLFQREGQIDEAFWLIFYFVHFGKNRRTGWQLARQVYGYLGGARRWDWVHTKANPKSFRAWLNANRSKLRGGFGNHRKYQSLDASSPAGTGAAFESYIRWVSVAGSHQALIEAALRESGRDARRAFGLLYHSMDAVASFGRTAKFDYLTMVGKLGLAQIEPGSTYMQGATGPVAGARLLFSGSANLQTSRSALDPWLIELEGYLGLNFGMQVLEDALCNWQKSPARFKPFRG